MRTLQEAMVAGFSLRAIIGYLNSNDLNGLQGNYFGDRKSHFVHSCVDIVDISLFQLFF